MRRRRPTDNLPRRSELTDPIAVVVRQQNAVVHRRVTFRVRQHAASDPVIIVTIVMLVVTNDHRRNVGVRLHRKRNAPRARSKGSAPRSGRNVLRVRRHKPNALLDQCSRRVSA